jgi:AcrR family transcriptional regulator
MRTTQGRDPVSTRKEILAVAFYEFFTRGFNRVSIDEIITKTKLTKGALYHHFPTKLDLGYAVADEVIRPMILERWITPLNAYSNPLQGMISQLKKHIGEVPLADRKYGCPLNNLVQEMAGVDSGFRSRLETSLELWIKETETHIKRGIENKTIKRTTNARALAEFIVLNHEGYFGMQKGLPSVDLFPRFIKNLQLVFAQYSC